MPTYEDVVKKLAHDWRTLRAWRAPLPAKLQFEEYLGQHIVGLATTGWASADRTALIRLTGRDLYSLAFDLGTVLHELAHLAAPRYVHHEEPWRELFVASCVEVCGGSSDTFDLDVVITDLDAQIRGVMRHWLIDTGQATVLRAIGVIGGEVAANYKPERKRKRAQP